MSTAVAGVASRSVRSRSVQARSVWPRTVRILLLAATTAVGLLGTPAAASEVRAAAPDLTIVSAARYDVQPDQQRVHVTLSLTLTNHLTDTVTKRYYFDQAYLAVLPGTTGFGISWAGSGTPTVRATSRTKDVTILRLDLGQRLYSGKTATYVLRFDVPDPGGVATRDIRIGDALVSFPVWAFASEGTPGSSVTVVFPAGYQIQVGSGSIPKPTMDPTGRTIFRTGPLSTPLTFFAYLVADRPGAYQARTIAPSVSGTKATVTIRSWPDDPAWGKRVATLMDRALPVLGIAIGLPWGRTDPLVVQEAASRSTGGYAGLFDPTQGLVDVAYYANDLVVLHEAAHAWFNGSLLADRWANEAFASYYGSAAASVLKVTASVGTLTPTLETARIPLNAWEAIGRESSATEDYAYAASLTLAKAIAARAGDDGLRRVWADAAAGIGAYQPPVAPGGAAGSTASDPELVAGPPDWRGLLDLLESDTDATYDDLWRTWVARPADVALLDARDAARTRYAEVLATAGEWALPRDIRDALRAWRFDDASAMLDQAGEALTQRDRIDDAAASVGLTPPGALRAAFERDATFDTADHEATAELQAITHYHDAAAARPVTADVLTTLGLWDRTPAVDLAAAASAFGTGDLAASVRASDAAADAWSSAAEVGRGRALSLAALAVAAVLAVLLLMLAIRGHRRRRHRMHAHVMKGRRQA